VIRIGLLGCAHVHAADYVADLRVDRLNARPLAVFDTDRERAVAFAAQHGLTVADDPDGLCRKVDAVIVVSEHRRYPEMVSAAAAAGRPVLCEKPLGATPEDCRSLLSTPAWLSVSFPVRYAQPVLRARDLIAGGSLGMLLAMSGTNRGAFPGGFFGIRALAGGGAIIDHVVHVADALRFLTGCEYKTVYAEAGQFRPVGDVEDCAQILATTTEGAWASIDPSWSRPPDMPGALDFEMTLWFEHGWMHLDEGGTRGMLVGSDGRIAYQDHGEGTNVKLLADWISAFTRGGLPPIPASDGAKATSLALAAVRSAASGEVVAVDDAMA